MVYTLLNHIQGKNGSRWAHFVREVGGENLLLVAIDAAKYSHKGLICPFYGDILVRPFDFDASLTGFKKLKDLIKSVMDDQGMKEVVVGLETTGHYYEDLVRRSKDEGFHVRILNAATTAKERDALLNWSKTDNLDLMAIVQSIMHGRGTSNELATGKVLDLQKLTRARHDLVKEQTAVKNLIRVYLDHIFREFQGKSVWKDGKRQHVKPFSKLFGKAPRYLMRHGLHPSDILALGAEGLRTLSINCLVFTRYYCQKILINEDLAGGEQMSNDSIFQKKYEIISDCPKAMAWGNYEFETIKAYKELLESQRDNENAFQEFFEKNPSMIPGAFGFFGESGHAPYNNILITQPQLNGVTKRIPDFLWIATDSCTIYPVFVEIEKPSKQWFTKSGQPTADFTQAQTQLAEWKTWFQNPTHQYLFFEFYEIDTEYRRGKTITPYYVLIYGSRDEFQNRPDLNEKRNCLNRNNEIYMTFNRLSPNAKARNVITCNKTSDGYIARNIPPTFRLGPVFSKEMSRVKAKEDAIRKSLIPEKRKVFLLSRLAYWNDFGKRDPRGIRSTSDWE